MNRTRDGLVSKLCRLGARQCKTVPIVGVHVFCTPLFKQGKLNLLNQKHGHFPSTKLQSKSPYAQNHRIKVCSFLRFLVSFQDLKFSFHCMR